MSGNEIHNPLYRFLTAPRFRPLRHLLLILSIGIILANHIYLTFEGHTNTINMPAIMGIYLVAYLTVAYLNIYLLIPRLLLKNKYAEYTLAISALVILLLVSNNIAEAAIYNYYQLPFSEYSYYAPGRSQTLEMISGFLLFTIYLVSITLIVFYKHWLQTTLKVERLKAEQLRTELDNFKSRISSEFLFGKLQNAAAFCRTAPSNASRVLLMLSRILRYQLYDSGRETVLLSSEIKFLNNFLSLEKLCNDRFDFEITHTPLRKPHFVPPLLFVTFIEESLRHLSDLPGTIRLRLNFVLTGNTLIFICTDNRTIATTHNNTDYTALTKRLDLLPDKNYSLSAGPDSRQNSYSVYLTYEIQP